MPVYHFTYHAYGTWWPDHPKGFVQQGKGIQARNANLAVAYRNTAKHQSVKFGRATQRILIEKLHNIASTEALVIHGISTDRTHLHVLVSWNDDRSWSKLRGRIKNLLSLCLSRRAGTTGRPWFVKHASRKRVAQREHFDYLLTIYFPKHPGWQWYHDRGMVEPPPRGGG